MTSVEIMNHTNLGPPRMVRVLMCVDYCFHGLLRDLPELGEDFLATFDSFRDIYDYQTLRCVDHDRISKCIANSNVDIICNLVTVNKINNCTILAILKDSR